MSKYKLLAVDMDGTLLNSQKKITPRTVAVLTELAKRGVHIVTSTGRGRADISDYPEVIKLMNYGILNSGGLLFDFVRDEPIAIHGVDEDKILRIIDFGLEERAMIHLLGVRQSLACEADIQNMAAFDMAVYHDMFNRVCTRCDDFKGYVRTHPGEIIKVNLYHRDAESRDRNLARMSKMNLSISFAEAFNLEASPANITKASGLVELCDYLKIDIAEAVAIGDAHNDTEVLQVAGCGVAMGNASDAIKKLADFVTLDNDSDGVAAAVEKIFFA